MGLPESVTLAGEHGHFISYLSAVKSELELILRDRNIILSTTG